jgi:hypothetical protein
MSRRTRLPLLAAIAAVTLSIAGCADPLAPALDNPDSEIEAPQRDDTGSQGSGT